MPFLNPRARYLRVSTGIKSGPFAEKLHINQGTLLNAETGLRTVSIEVANRIANELNKVIDEQGLTEEQVTVDDLIDHDRTTPRGKAGAA